MKEHESGVLVFTADNEITASMAEALLTDNGIPVLRKYRGSGLCLKIVLGDTNNGIDLYVPEAAYDRAKELLELLLEVEDAEFEDTEEYPTEG